VSRNWPNKIPNAGSFKAIRKAGFISISGNSRGLSSADIVGRGPLKVARSDHCFSEVFSPALFLEIWDKGKKFTSHANV
jgi:hypothetical protein